MKKILSILLLTALVFLGAVNTAFADRTAVGGGGSFEIPSGSVNGINATYVVTEAPAMVFTEQGNLVEGFGYTYSAGQIVLDIPPQDYIRIQYGTVTTALAVPQTFAGTYLGTGSPVNINLGVDMREEEGNLAWVIVKADASGTDREAWWRFPFNWHRRADRFTTNESRGGDIITFTSTGFTVDSEGSPSGVTMHYFAYLDNGSKSIVGSSYHGNATAGRVIRPSPGETLAAALIKRDSTQPSVWAFGPGSGTALARTWEGNSSSAIIGSGLDGDKVTLDTGNEINQWNSTFGEGIHILGFTENTQNTYVTRYTGSGLARTITLPWQPAAIFIIPYTPPTGATTMRMWFESLGTSGTLPVSNGAGVISGEVTSVTSTGFSLGTGNSVNENGIVYGVIAIRKRTSAEANNVIPRNLVYKSSASVDLDGGYIDMGTDNSLSITGPMTLIWEGTASGTPLSLAPIDSGGDINNQANTQFPLLFRSSGADATDGAISYGLELAASQTTQPFVSTDPWLGATLLVATRNRWEMMYGGPANLDQFPMNTGIIQNEGKRTMIIAVHEGSGVWRIYKDHQLIKFRDRSVGTNITSNSGDRFIIGARQRDGEVVFPTSISFNQAAVYNRAFSHAEAIKASYAPYVGYDDIPGDYVERWKAEDRIADTLPAEINAANDGTIYETAPLPFAPSDIANYYADYDFQNAASITTSGGEITAITDQSGNGYNLTGSAGISPTYDSGSPDATGKFAAFATDDRLVSGFIPTPSAMTVFAVVAPTNAGSGDTARGATLGYELSFNYFALGSGNSLLSGETFSFIANSDRIGPAEAAYDWTAGESYVEVSSVGASGSTLRKNGGAAVSLSLATGGVTSSSNLAPGAYLSTPSTLRVGIGWNGVALFGPYTGKMYRLIIYNRQLSTSEITEVLDYLHTQFPGITVSPAS